MASKSAILAVKIVSDAKDFKKGTDDAASAVEKLSGQVKKLAIPAALIGAGIAKIGGDYVKMASELEQNSGAVDAVFKDHANQIKNLAGASAKNLGISGSDYQKYAALIGSQLKNAGTPIDQLGDKTASLIQTGADFAAQFGGTVPDAVEAMSSALKGEFDPIEKYGVSLSAAKIEAKAMAMGAQKVNGELTDQAKQAAILALINEQGADAMGANAREAGTAAGVQARLTAAYEDMGAKIGTALLPVMTTLGDILGKVVDWVSQNTGLVTALAIGLGVLAAAIVVLNVVMAIMNAIALVNPFVLVGLAVAVVIGFIIALATQTTFFQDVWAAVSAFCADAWNGFVGFISDVWNGFVGFITDTVNNIGNVWNGFVGWIGDVWNGFVGFIQDTLGNIGSFFSSIFSGIGNFVRGILSGIGNFFSSIFNGARNVVFGVISGIMGFFSSMWGTISSILNAIGSWFGSIFNGVSNIVSNVINGIIRGFNSISSVVSSVIGWVSRLFNGFSVPGWLRQVMNFMGVGATGFEMSAAMDLTGLPAGMGATGTQSLIGALGNSGSKTEVNNYTITVNGALDANSVARQLKTIINSDAKRNGSISAGGSVW